MARVSFGHKQQWLHRQRRRIPKDWTAIERAAWMKGLGKAYDKNYGKKPTTQPTTQPTTKPAKKKGHMAEVYRGGKRTKVQFPRN